MRVLRAYFDVPLLDALALVKSAPVDLPTRDLPAWRVKDLRRDLVQAGATVNRVRCEGCLDDFDGSGFCWGANGRSHVHTTHGRTPLPQDLTSVCGAMLGVAACGHYMGIPVPLRVCTSMSQVELRAALKSIDCEECHVRIRQWFIEQFARAVWRSFDFLAPYVPYPKPLLTRLL